MKKTSKKFQMDGVLVLLLTAVFAACLLLVLLTGAGGYRRLTERDRAADARRTALQYVATKVRQGDTAGGVTLREFGGLPALCLTDTVDGAVYETYLYEYDGYLRELFAAADAGLSPADGEKVLESHGLTLALSDGLLQIETAETALTLSLRSGGTP
ncbi:MAG: DUF4860 domain-containing protein [Oscillibacter sp.]